MFEKLYLQRFNILFLVLISTYLNILWVKDLDLVLANASDLLPYINFFNNPSLFHDDLAQIYLPKTASFYYILPALLGKFIDAHVITYGIYILSNTLSVFAIFYLSYYLFRNAIAGFISVFLLMGVNLSVFAPGNYQPFGCNAFPALFAIPFLIIAIIYFLKEKYYVAFSLGGIMFNFHGSHSIFVLFMFFVYFIMKCKDISFKTIFGPFLLFIALASPLILWIAFSSPIDLSGTTAQQWIKFITMHHSGHIFPSAFNFSWEVLPFFTVLILYLISLRYIPKDKTWDTIKIFSLAIFILCVLGTVFSEFIPIPLIMKLTLFRSTLILTIFMVIYVIQILIVGPLQNNDGFLRKMSSLGLFISLSIIFTKWWIFYCVVFPFLILQVSLLEKKGFRLSQALFWLAMILFGGLVFISAAPHFGLKQVDNGPLYVGLRNIGKFIIFVLIFSLIDYLARKKDLRVVRDIVIGGIAFFLMILNFHSFTWGSEYKNYLREWKDVQLWCKRNSSIDDTFITPPYLRGFRVYSERPIVGSFYDLSNVIYVPEVMSEGIKRMKDLGIDSYSSWKSLSEWKRRYNALSENEFIELGKKYGASYIVVEKIRYLNFTQVYENKLFRVYKF